MRLLIATALLLSACGPGVSIGPGAHCTGRLDAEIGPAATLSDAWSARLAEILDHCAPMLKVTVKSYTGE